MSEWGIFNDEGCVERGFYSAGAAHEAAAQYDEDDQVHANPLCPEHEEQEAPFCEECAEEEEAYDQ